MINLTERALELLREHPYLVQDAKKYGRTGATAIGDVLRDGYPQAKRRQIREAVVEALAILGSKK
jgi:hypothetical protein